MARKLKKTTEDQLLEEAVEAFHAETGLHAVIVREQKDAREGPGVDGYLDVNDPGGRIGRYAFELKTNLTPNRVAVVAGQLKALPLKEPRLLIADHVTAPVARMLRDLGVQFIDAAGNAWLHFDDPRVHIQVTGNKRNAATGTGRPVAAFREKGLRVIFPLLCLPDAANETYRQIADWADVALGTVANTFEDLERLGYLRKAARGRVLENRAELQRRWVEGYAQELRPRLKPQRFKVLYPGWEHEFPWYGFERKNLWLGGEGAAQLLTRYLHAELITVYGEPDLPELAKELKLARSEEGNLELLQRFWNFEVPKFDALCEEQRFCPPLLIYADLVLTAEARQLEAAAMIKEKYLDAQGNG